MSSVVGHLFWSPSLNELQLMFFAICNWFARYAIVNNIADSSMSLLCISQVSDLAVFGRFTVQGELKTAVYISPSPAALSSWPFNLS